ncbi:hypothetical protein [Cryobacterium sp. PH29-G1]|uniref:hypothetical protein n=1 Tax=Cryobacterium sp. PH29-G1 TaxID=3046211 RepID=UPI0024B95BB5|nr:hypothetical protein [Cryobacterium sp. PH29-G1]MDJ0347985.1 hypothetical protein [Cryobacterium sp. PH29-G1]
MVRARLGARSRRLARSVATIGLVAGALSPFTIVAGLPAPAAAETTAAVSVDYTEVVWTAGWQDEIDACRGAVDVGDRYGTPVIAEHWSCGGSWFPAEGSTVALTGAVTGTFRVGPVAVVLNAATDKAGAIPHGYDLLYQTCVDGSSATMSFTELTRIR